MQLNQQQRLKFDQQGFLLVENAVTAAQLRGLREQFAKWVEESKKQDQPYGETLDGRARFDLEPGHSAAQPALRRVSSPTELSPAYFDVMRDSAMTDFVANLIGPAIRFHHSKINSKLPGASTAVKWHQDFPFTPHSNDDLVTALLMIDEVTAENGPLLYKPASKETITLASSPSDEFILHLRSCKIPISVGRTIVSTVRPHEIAALEIIRELGLDMQVIFNKEAVMMVPAGRNKATGLREALRLSGLSPHNVVGIGDAENDLAFLGMVECAGAVANALPAIKEHADFLTDGEQGEGVVDLIGRLIEDDLSFLDSQLHRHYLNLGTAQKQDCRLIEDRQDVLDRSFGPHPIFTD